MLGKLIKHEFRATGRIMLPLYLVLLVTAVGANFASRGILETEYWVLDVLGGLLVTAFGVAIMGVCLMSFVLMVQRFYKNLLQDEGYVMLTLPVSVHQHIWAKLIVSAVWFVATVIAVFAASLIMAFNIGVIGEVLEGFAELMNDLRYLEISHAFNGTVFLAELAALCFLGLAAMCLQFYAALAIGHGFPNRKMVWSVGAFFALQFIIQFLGINALILLDKLNFDFFGLLHVSLHGAAAVHLGMLLVIAGVVLYGAIFYFLTAYFLKRRLNLE